MYIKIVVCFEIEMNWLFAIKRYVGKHTFWGRVVVEGVIVVVVVVVVLLVVVGVALE